MSDISDLRYDVARGSLNLNVGLISPCPICMPYSFEFNQLVMRGLDPKYNYQLHQIFLNPVGTIMLFMYWIPLAQKYQRHHPIPINETSDWAIFV